MALAPLPTSKDSMVHQEVATSPFPILREPRQGLTKTATNALSGLGSVEEQRMQELERMLQEAQGRAEMMEREAYDKAYAAGEKAGMALGKKRAEQILDGLNDLMVEADKKISDLETVCSDAVLDVSQAILEHVLGNLDEERQAMLVSAVQQAALQFPDITDLKLLVNLDDLKSFERLLSKRERENWHIHAGSDVNAGCCRLVSQKQDIQIDPMEAVRRSVDALRIRLQSSVSI